MIRQRIAIGAGLVIAWALFAAWQYQRLGYERALIGESTRHSARSVMSALIGGIQSHRRLGRYFEQQLEGMLVEVTGGGDVLAAAVLDGRAEPVMQAGRVDLLVEHQDMQSGDRWIDGGFRLVQRFHIEPVGEAGPGWGSGGLGGPGFGGGRGLGRRQEAEELPEPFGTGGTFYAVLVLDRTRHDQLVRQSVWSCVFVSLAGGLVLVSVALAWRASVRLVEARGREKLLETETRHWRELSQAAAGLAHETRNPLGLIRGWTQRLAEDDADRSVQRQHAFAVIEECDRVTARINHFLAFARPCEPHPQPVDVPAIVEQLRIILQPDFESKDLRLEFEPEIGICSILADPELLRQTLFNLLQNAVQFAPLATAVTIGLVRERAGTCCLTVADRGPGVEKEIEDAIFAPYFTTRAGGTGLGLAIIRRIALAHGWTVTCASRPGGGAVFCVGGIHGSDQTDHPGRGRRSVPAAATG
jgi:signal transduction histidine kinase